MHIISACILVALALESLQYSNENREREIEGNADMWVPEVPLS
jgi:hypothetical protein